MHIVSQSFSTMEEVWKPTHVSSLYEVSNNGNVRRILNGTIRKNSINKNGIQYLTLPTDGRDCTHLIGRLVLSVFDRFPNVNEKAIHKNGNKEDDRIENLCWESMENIETELPSIICKHVIVTNNRSGETYCFVSALEASYMVEASRSSVYDSIRFGKSIDGYLFSYDQPIGEIRKIPGTSHHMVSSTGQVKQLNGNWTFGSRNWQSKKDHTDGDIKKSNMRVELTTIVGGISRSIRKYVHCLVAEAFIGNSDSSYKVFHLNGDNTDNKLSNLEYVTCSSAGKHVYETGARKPPGQKPVLYIKQDGTYTRFESKTEGAEIIGCSGACVSKNCKSGKSNKKGCYWAHDNAVIKPGTDGSPAKKFKSIVDASEGKKDEVLSIFMSIKHSNEEGSWEYENQ